MQTANWIVLFILADHISFVVCRDRKMTHFGTTFIETDRLILRRFCEKDAKAMYENWASDDEVTKYLTWPSYKNAEEANNYILFLVEEYKKPTTYNWAIELKEIGQVIGSIGVVEQKQEIGCVHVGYCIGRTWWQKGITTEALSAVIKFFMEQVGINRIESRHDPRNVNSGKVMKKCGLEYEGIQRQSDWNNQGICDAVWYSLLREEYFC